MRAVPHLILWRLGLVRAETQTIPEERECLARHAAGRRRVVEVGVWHGVTTKVLRSAMSPEGDLYAIDPYPVGRLGFSAQRIVANGEVGSVSNGTVHWLRMTGVEAARWYASTAAPPVELVFIDGDHSFAGLKGDWEAWSPLVAVGGAVGLHDSRPVGTRTPDTGSVRFTREVILADPRFEVVAEVESLTMLRRRGT